MLKLSFINIIIILNLVLVNQKNLLNKKLKNKFNHLKNNKSL